MFGLFGLLTLVVVCWIGVRRLKRSLAAKDNIDALFFRRNALADVRLGSSLRENSDAEFRVERYPDSLE